MSLFYYLSVIVQEPFVDRLSDVLKIDVRILKIADVNFGYTRMQIMTTIRYHHRDVS